MQGPSSLAVLVGEPGSDAEISKQLSNFVVRVPIAPDWKHELLVNRLPVSVDAKGAISERRVAVSNRDGVRPAVA